MPTKKPARPSRERLDARARIAKALAHPSRLMMLEALSEGERSVSELTALIEADQSTASRHLGVLREVGLVAARKQAQHSLYRLQVACLSGFWQCVESVLEENLKRQKSLLEDRRD